MMRFCFLMVTSFFLASPVVNADILFITDPAYQVANSPDGVPRPVRGMSMKQVGQAFGQPVSTVPPIGEPPITRWIYNDFEVYFENNTVIHSVVPHSP